MRTLLIVVLLSLPIAAAAEEAAPPTVADLAWLAGAWCSSSENATAEEYWVAPHGGVVLGLHRDVRAGGRAFFEHLLIVEEDGALVYYASPAGRPATPFTLIEAGERRAVFANPEHDYPQRIIYERDGDQLTATIEGDVAGETRASGWRWRKDACGFLAEEPAHSPVTGAGASGEATRPCWRGPGGTSSRSPVGEGRK